MCGHHLMHYIPMGHDHSHLPTSRTPEPVYSAPQVATRPCPQCKSPLQEDFVFCPRCGAEILSACPSCHRAVQTNWTRCAYCGTDLLAAKTQAPTHSES